MAIKLGTKIKRNKVSKKDKKSADAIMVGSEVGHSGITISGGVIDFEYQKKLKNLGNRMDVYQKMRSDGSVDVSLNLLEFPLQGETVNVFPGSDAPEDVERADFIRDNFVEQTSISTTYSYWDHKQEELKYLQYGFFPFEKVFEKGIWIRQDGTIQPMTVLKKLASRHPTSIDSWSVSGNEVDGLFQNPPMGDIISKNTTSSVFIPMEKMVIYVNSKVGDNWEGISILRPVLKHWTYKDGLYKIEAIGLQKTAMPIPALYINRVSDDKIAKAKKLVRSIMVHEEAGFVLEEGAERAEFLASNGITTVAIHRSIAHHDSKILQNVLAGFMLLGQESRGGARNLGASLQEMFMILLDSKAKYSENIKNRYIIPDMVDANYTNTVRYPYIKVHCSRIGDKAILADILNSFVDRQIVDPYTSTMQDYVNTVFGYPKASSIKEKAGEEIKKPFKEDIVNDETEITVRENYPKTKNTEDINKFRQKWLKNIRWVVDKQKEELSKQTEKLLKMGQIPNINYLDVPYEDVYRSLVYEYCDAMNQKFPEFGMAVIDVDKLVSVHNTEVKASMAKSLIEIAKEKGTIPRV